MRDEEGEITSVLGYFARWEETSSSRGNPHGHGENMQRNSAQNCDVLFYNKWKVAVSKYTHTYIAISSDQQQSAGSMHPVQTVLKWHLTEKMFRLDETTWFQASICLLETNKNQASKETSWPKSKKHSTIHQISPIWSSLQVQGANFMPLNLHDRF